MKQGILFLLLLSNVAFCQIMILDCKTSKLLPIQFSLFSRFLSLPKGKDSLPISAECFDAFKNMFSQQGLITIKEGGNAKDNTINTNTNFSPKLNIERTKKMPGFIGYYAEEDKLYIEFIELTSSYHTEMGIIRDLLNQVSDNIQTTIFIYTYSSPCTFCVEEYYRLIKKYKKLVFYIGYTEIYKHNPFTKYFVKKNDDLPMIRQSKVFKKVCDVDEKEIQEIITIQTKKMLIQYYLQSIAFWIRLTK